MIKDRMSFFPGNLPTCTCSATNSSGAVCINLGNNPAGSFLSHVHLVLLYTAERKTQNQRRGRNVANVVAAESGWSLMESDVVSVSRRPGRRRPVETGRRRRGRCPVARRVSWTSAAGQRVCRKYRRGRVDVVGRLQQREFNKLRRIVPALCSTSQTRPPRRVSKVTDPAVHTTTTTSSSNNSKQPCVGLYNQFIQRSSSSSCQLTCFMYNLKTLNRLQQ